jgi:hypothetical protein
MIAFITAVLGSMDGISPGPPLAGHPDWQCATLDLQISAAKYPASSIVSSHDLQLFDREECPVADLPAAAVVKPK